MIASPYPPRAEAHLSPPRRVFAFLSSAPSVFFLFFSLSFSVISLSFCCFLTIFFCFLSLSSPQILRLVPPFFCEFFLPPDHVCTDGCFWVCFASNFFFCILLPSNKILALGDKCDRLGPSAASLFLVGVYDFFLATKCANPPMFKGECPLS